MISVAAPPSDPRTDPPLLIQLPPASLPSPPLPDPNVPDPVLFPVSLPIADPSLEVYVEDENLSAVERIYVLSRSKNPQHRVFIARSLHAFLPGVSPLEAVEYVLPLLNILAVDEEDIVKEALATELVSIMWWFFQNCRIMDDDTLDSQEDPPLLPVQSFTPILGSLLIDHNTMIGGPARFAVVEILNRLHAANDNGEDSPPFGIREREMLEQEIIHQVIIGMGRLDISGETSPSPVSRAGGTLTPQSPVSLTNSLAITSVIVPDSQPPSESSQTVQQPPALSITPSPLSDTVPPPLIEVIPSILDSPRGDNGHDAATPSVYPPTSASKENIVQCSPQTPQSNASAATLDDSVLDDEVGSDVWLTADGMNSQEAHDNDQAAVGRLSSMSMIATVTANAKLPEDTIRAFADEVVYIGSDPLFWVRREASFAVGALAKVVPTEVLSFSLLPLFEMLVHDDVWRVRHSAIFALPGILGRLTPQHRRSLALQTVVTLAADTSLEVRSGVLEVLGEVIYTFHEDEGGAPVELVDLFVGRETRAEECHPGHWQIDPINSKAKKPPDSLLPKPPEEVDRLKEGILPQSDLVNTDHRSTLAPQSAMGSFFRDPARTLITSFNYPAVALSLGPQRWSEVRDYYLALSRDPNVRVRRTIAAGLGEMARILGTSLAQRDLLNIWDDMVHDEDDGITRLKALGGVSQFIGALDGQTRDDSVGELVELWERWLTGWRERECLTMALPQLALLAEGQGGVIRTLMMKSLVDSVAAVREAAIATFRDVLQGFDRRPYIAEGLRDDLSSLARADLCRRRTTYVACCGALISGPHGKAEILREDFWKRISHLSQDHMLDVRIGVARLVGVICDKFYPDISSRPAHIIEVIRRLIQDPSRDVRDFVAFSRTPNVLRIPQLNTPLLFATFSRPPSIVPSEGPVVGKTTITPSCAEDLRVCRRIPDSDSETAVSAGGTSVLRQLSGEDFPDVYLGGMTLHSTRYDNSSWNVH